MHRAVDGQGLSGASELGYGIGIGGTIGMFTGEEGNDLKDIDADIFGNPNADKEAEKPGSVADAREDQKKSVAEMKDKPDASRFGAFG